MKHVTLTPTQFKKQVKHIPFNRSYSVLKKLQESMIEFGFTVPVIIICTDALTKVKEWFVADGQHRAAAAIALGIKIDAVIVDRFFETKEQIVRFIAALNSKTTPWKVVDYCNAYIALNNDHYMYLNKRANETGFSHSILAILYNGTAARRMGSIKRSIENGTFEIRSKIKAEETLEYASELGNYKLLSNRMLLALHNVMLTNDGFNRESFMKRYKKDHQKLKELKLDDYTQIFTNWSN